MAPVEIVWTARPDGWVTAATDWEAATGLPPASVLGRGWLEGLHPDDRPRAEAAWAAATAGGGAVPYDLELRFRAADGGWRWRHVRGRPVRDTGTGAVREWIGVAQDMEARRAAEAAAAAAEARARLALRAGGLVAWEIEAETGQIVTDAGLAALFGVPAEQQDGTMTPFAARIHPADRERVLAEFAAAAAVPGGSYRAEFRVLPEAGGERWLLGVGEGVPGPDGRLRVVGYNADITAAKQAEAALREALEVREMLLTEVNHRVKNSLQLVSSLLSLQASRAGSEETRAALDEARGRIGVLARLHQQLYRTGLANAVDLVALLRELCTDTAALLAGADRIVIAFDPSPGTPVLVLPIDRAVPAALIVSELLTNALKYAYPEGGSGGTVRVTLQREPAMELQPAHLVITVEDDGAGLPAGFSTAAPRGVGMRVVTTLARQLRAGFSVRPGATGQGAAFELRLPLPGML